jgi:hypothetical protein
MSALLRDEPDEGDLDREALRSMVTVYPLQTVFEHQAWTMDSYALPIPPLLRRLVRDGRTWRLAVHAAMERYQPGKMGEAERAARKDEYETFVRTLMYLGPDSDAFGRLVLRLFPAARCGFRGCREPYLRYSQRVLHCSDFCRRAQTNGLTYGTGIKRAPACVVCGGPLSGRQRRYCGEPCERRLQNARRKKETGDGHAI